MNGWMDEGEGGISLSLYQTRGEAQEGGGIGKRRRKEEGEEKGGGDGEKGKK